MREFGQSYTRGPGEEEGEFECEVDETSPSAGNPDLAADSEGLTIYRYGRGKGYLLGSSQGSSSFLVYDLTSLRQLRTFAIGDGTTDAVDDSDGAMVVGVPLGRTFAKGLLVTHDGNDEPSDGRHQLQVHPVARRGPTAPPRNRHRQRRPTLGRFGGRLELKPAA